MTAVRPPAPAQSEKMGLFSPEYRARHPEEASNPL